MILSSHMAHQEQRSMSKRPIPPEKHWDILKCIILYRIYHEILPQILLGGIKLPLLCRKYVFCFTFRTMCSPNRYSITCVHSFVRMFCAI